MLTPDIPPYMTPARAGQAVAHSWHSGDRVWFWKLVLQARDHLKIILDAPETEQFLALRRAWAREPWVIGDERVDTLLAALARIEYETRGLSAPEWTRRPPLTSDWVLEHPFLDEKRIRARTPAWLDAVRIYVPARDLRTA